LKELLKYIKELRISLEEVMRSIERKAITS